MISCPFKPTSGCSTWTRLLRRPKVLSIWRPVFEWAWLYCPCALFCGLLYGVKRNIHYPKEEHHFQNSHCFPPPYVFWFWIINGSRVHVGCLKRLAGIWHWEMLFKMLVEFNTTKKIVDVLKMCASCTELGIDINKFSWKKEEKKCLS